MLECLALATQHRHTMKDVTVNTRRNNHGMCFTSYTYVKAEVTVGCPYLFQRKSTVHTARIRAKV